jgi:hypothetical protein
VIAGDDNDERDAALVRIIPVEAPFGTPQFGSGKGWFRMADDFDDPLPDFDEYQ